MGVIEVQIGDRIAQFPDTMSKEDITNAILKYQQNQPNFLEKGINLVDKTIDWFKGGKREDNIPLANQANLGLGFKDASKLVALLATTASDDRLQSGIKKIIPNAEFDKDDFGNLVAIVPKYKDGKPTQQFTRFYPNPKGLDVTDLMQASGAVTLGQAIAYTGGAAGVPVTGLTGSGLVGMTEAGLVEAISARLSNAKTKLTDPIYGFFGGVAGKKIADVGAGIVNMFKGNPNALFDANGILKPKVAADLQKAGIDPETVTPDTLAQISAKVNQKIDPLEAQRLVEAETLPVPVPMTSGAVTGSKGQQLFEDMAGSGAFGQTAENIMAGQRAKTQDAIQQNIPAIRDEIGKGSETITEIGQAGPGAQEFLVTQKARASKAADDLYKRARSSSPAFMDQAEADVMVDRITNEMSENFEFENIPGTATFLTQMRDIVSDGADIRKLFALRARITNQSKELGQAGSSAGKLKDLLDDELTSALETALIYGDEAAVLRWKTAIRNYKDFSNTWNSKGGILNTLTEETIKDGTKSSLKVSPERASNVIFNASGKLSNNPQVVQQLTTLKNKLPLEQWNQIRQEAFLRLARAGQTQKAGVDSFSGDMFRKELKKLMSDNKGMLKTLFSPKELSLINQFASVSARATGGAVNASNSANAAFNALGKLAAAFGSTNLGTYMTRAVGINTVRNLYGSARASIATRGGTTPRSSIGAGPGGAALTDEEIQNAINAQFARTTGAIIGSGR
jgi:hypothetical protein